MEGMLKKVGDVEFVYYKQLGGDMIRCDIFKGNISDLEEYKDYEILEFYQNGDRITHYLKPKAKNEVETYTDTTGVTYKTSSIYVYIDREGNYRTFSDDTKEHLEHNKRALTKWEGMYHQAINSPFEVLNNEKNINFIKKEMDFHKKQIEKYEKDLMKGL